MKVGLGALLVSAAFIYAFLGPLVFDAGYWVLGKVARVRADRRLRVGVSIAFVAVYLAAVSVSGSKPPGDPSAKATATTLVAANGTEQSASATSTGLASLTASPSLSPMSSASASSLARTASQSPTAAASDADTDDETSSTAGASFAANATGIVPPTSGAAAADRLPGEPDPALTPGALNPAVTQATIGSTICVSGWTATIRPSSSFTTALKIKQIVQYGYSDTKTSSYEEDHLISLELGGAPADARNLWPEPYTASLADGRSTGAHIKDGFETKLKNQVCAGTITLAAAQGEIGDHWVHAYYSIALTASPTAEPSATPSPASTDAPSETAVTPKPATPKPVAPEPTPTDANAAAKAAGATAICADGTWSYSPTRSGTCSQHGGVHWWTGNVGAAGPGAH